MYIFAAVSNRKRKPRRFSLICLLFAHLQTEVCRFSICLRRKKLKLSFYKQTKRTCSSMGICYLSFFISVILSYSRYCIGYNTYLTMPVCCVGTVFRLQLAAALFSYRRSCTRAAAPPPSTQRRNQSTSTRGRQRTWSSAARLPPTRSAL
jgi:hypothetical protein